MCIGVGQGIATVVERVEAERHPRFSARVLDETRCLAYDEGRRRDRGRPASQRPGGEHRLIDQQPTVVSLTDAAAAKLRS